MHRIDIGFRWPVAHEYVIDQISPPETGATLIRSRGPHVIARGGIREWKEPTLRLPTLFMYFASLDGSPEACLDFARTWGLLGLSVGKFDSPEDRGKAMEPERLASWQSVIEDFRSWTECWQRGILPEGVYLPIGRLQFGLARREGRRWTDDFALRLTPSSLLVAMHLQFAAAAARSARIRACDLCGTWFEAGPSGDRRRDARFCSDQCKRDYNNRRRKSAGGHK